nr:MAG TPA: DNA-binding protein [Caudoviricetes sp.]
MTEKEFVRALVAECKRNGYRISQPNVKKVIKSLRNLTFKTCLEGEEVRLLGFCTFTPEETRDVILPNGEHNKKRTVIRVKLTEVFKRRFRDTAVLVRDGAMDISDIHYNMFFEDDEEYDDLFDDLDDEIEEIEEQIAELEDEDDEDEIDDGNDDSDDEEDDDINEDDDDNSEEELDSEEEDDTDDDDIGNEETVDDEEEDDNSNTEEMEENDDDEDTDDDTDSDGELEEDEDETDDEDDNSDDEEESSETEELIERLNSLYEEFRNNLRGGK